MRMAPLLLLPGLLAAPARAGLDEAAALSEQARSAPGREEASALAFQALGRGVGRVAAPQAVVYGSADAGAPSGLSPSQPRRRGSVSERIGRPVGQAPGGGARVARAGKAAAGALAGALLGAIVGAVAGAAILGWTQNPKLRRWRYGLILPGAVAGAVVGQFVLPVAFARFFTDAESYKKPARWGRPAPESAK